MGESTELGASIGELINTAGEARERRQEKQAWLDNPKQKMIAYAKQVSREHDMGIDFLAFQFRVSQRTRNHGAFTIERRGGVSWGPIEEKTLDVSIKALENHGVDHFKKVIRHELIHVWQFQNGHNLDHGATFEQWMDDLDVDCKAEDFRADAR